jgi:hypothetical protein
MNAIINDYEKIDKSNLTEEERKEKIKEIIALHFWDYHERA